MPVIRVTGFPNELNVQKQLHALRGYLRRCEVEKFWINEIADIRGTDLREAGIEVPTDEDWYSFQSFVNKVPYRKAGIPYFLKAEIVNNDYQDYRRTRSRSPHSHKGGRRSRGHSYDRYSPHNSQESYRSRSPLYEDTTNQMNVELEFLRKKRQLIEEERRLIAEKKKLEMMKEYGPDSYEHENSAVSRFQDRNRPKLDRGPERQINVHTLPLFIMPCRMIMKQLRPFTKKATKHEKPVFLKYVQGQVRRRIALVLNDREFMPTTEIMDLYRSSYPMLEDEAFVAKLLEDLRISLWPIKVIPEKVKPKKNTAGPRSRNVVKKVLQPKKNPVAIKKEDVDVELKCESAMDPATNKDQISTVVVKEETNVIKSETSTTVKSESSEVIKSELNATAKEESTVLHEDTTDWTKDDMTDMVDFESRPDVVDQASNAGGTGEAVAASVETSEAGAAFVEMACDEDDWVTNGVEWEDDGDVSKEDEYQDVA